MYSWMIGTVAGGFSVAWWSRLPAMELTLAAAVMALLCYVLARRLPLYRPLPSLAGGALAGMVFAVLWGHQLLQDRLPESLYAQVLPLQVRVLEPPRVRIYPDQRRRQRFLAELSSSACGDGDNCLPAGSRVWLSYYGPLTLLAGERWQLSARLKPPWGLANPGSFNYQSWLVQERIAATGSVRDRDIERLAPAEPWMRPHQLARQNLLQKLQRSSLEPRVRSLMGAIVVGQRGAISHSDWNLLQRLGLNHLMVVSGLHVAMVAGLGFWLGGLLGRLLVLAGRVTHSAALAHGTALILAIAYSALAGFALPTVRALVMLGLVQLGLLLRRRVQWRYTLCWALFLIFLLQPLAPLNAGFWLSVGAVIAIAALLTLRPELRGWRQIVYLQVVLSAISGLLASLWFGGSGVLAPLANLVAIPVLGGWVVPLGLLGAALQPLLPALGDVCWWLAAVPLSALLEAADYLAATDFLPWLGYHVSAPAIGLALVGVLVWLLPPVPRWRVLAVPLLIPLLLPRYPLLARDELQLTVLDVGQGLAVVVGSADHTLLYDTGAGDPQGPNMASSVVLPYLRQSGVDHLDALVISHGDSDHASGLGTVLARFPGAPVWFGEELPGAPLDTRRCTGGDRFRLGALSIDVLHPPAGAVITRRNNRSCVLLLEFGGYRILLPGDIESVVEYALLDELESIGPVGILLAPHHGSQTSSVPPFVARVRPDEVVFASGYLNRFDHPRENVVALYRRSGARIWRTGRQGAVRFTIKAGRLVDAISWRQQKRYYWH